MLSRNNPSPSPTVPPVHRRRRSRVLAGVAAGALVLTGVIAAGPAQADHPELSLTGSDFEIDTNANLTVQDPAPSIDWAGVDEVRQGDEPTGATDDSFGNGTKENTLVPSVVDGSIPPNKSDLLNFGLYLETTPTDHQFLHLFWHRVQEPQGTTNMDFEFNQSSTLTANGVTPVRTHGDLLIQYDLSQGGVNAVLSVSRWLTALEAVPWNACEAGSVPCWSIKRNFSALGLATGTVNSTPILAGNSDGLGPISARTFGEATVDFTALASTLDECSTFGSAYLKSRSSDSFTAALKDFIKPIETGFPTCGGVTIRKVTDPATTEPFSFTKDFSSDPSDNTFDLSDGESITFSDVPINVEGHVTESALPDGWDLVDIDCSASTGAPDVATDALTGVITFTLNSASDNVDCTYTNRARGGIVVEKITDNGFGSFDFTSSTLSPSPFTLTTTAAGNDGKDAETFSDLPPGTYDVAETVPANWNLVSATCSDGSDPASIGLSAGETVTCTFHDAREVGAIKIHKDRKHAAFGSDDYPHAGVTFTVTGGELPAGGVSVQTDVNGDACVPALLVSDLVGTYTVSETVPTGYHVVGEDSQTAWVSESEADCDPITDGASVEFLNMPLTNLTVTVDSQVDGGTKSTIDCVPGLPEPDITTGANGDGSLDLTDLEPQVVVCTIVIDP